MIIPSTVSKIVNFVDSEGNCYSEANEKTNKVKLQLDDGSVVEVLVESNDFNYNGKIYEFLKHKQSSVVKKDEITKISSSIVLDPDNRFDKAISSVSEKILLKTPDFDKRKLKPEAIKLIASNIAKRNREIKQKSIVRVPLSTTDTKNGQLFKSKFIQVENNNGTCKYSSSGLYYFAQTNNAIPVEITPIYKDDGTFSDFFRITTAKLITAGQINYFIDHCIRTTNNMVKKGSKPFLPKIETYGVANIPTELNSLFNKINATEKKNKEAQVQLAQNEYKAYIDTLEALKYVMKENNKLYKYFKASVPLVFNSDKMKNAIFSINASDGKSPLQVLSQAVVNLNFSRQNPQMKEYLKGMVDEYVAGIVDGSTNCKILATVYFAPSDVFGDSESWGYLPNNITASRFTLSYKDTTSLVDKLYKYVDQQKGA